MSQSTKNDLLLLDARNIKQIQNAQLALGTIQKSNHNPLFKEDFFADPPKRWEARYDNVYPTVLFDEQEEIYKCWYHAFLVDAESNSVSLADRPKVTYKGGEREDGVLYATSHDGIHWEKPNLGLIAFNGSTDNNIVMSLASHGVHSGGVIKDLNETNDARRYKYFHRNPGIRRMAVAFSPDGLHWSQPQAWPENDAVGDAHNNAVWSFELKRWVGITRGWTEKPYHGLRTVMRTESNDFIHWSKPIEVMRGQDAHDQIYSMPVARYGDLYIGLPSIFHKGNPDSPDWDTVDTELAWSPDTEQWHRICAETPLIPRGNGAYPDGDYDNGCVYAAPPIIKDDKIFIFYGGSNGLHNGWREGSMNLATLEKGRFASYVPTDQQHHGIVETTGMMPSSEIFTINAEINSGGRIRVALLDETGQVLHGFSLDDCIPIATGGISCQVYWNTATILSLGNKKIHILFELMNAKLYALSGFHRAAN